MADLHVPEYQVPSFVSSLQFYEKIGKVTNKQLQEQVQIAEAEYETAKEHQQLFAYAKEGAALYQHLKRYWDRFDFWQEVNSMRDGGLPNIFSLALRYVSAQNPARIENLAGDMSFFLSYLTGNGKIVCYNNSEIFDLFTFTRKNRLSSKVINSDLPQAISSLAHGGSCGSIIAMQFFNDSNDGCVYGWDFDLFGDLTKMTSETITEKLEREKAQGTKIRTMKMRPFTPKFQIDEAKRVEKLAEFRFKGPAWEWP